MGAWPSRGQGEGAHATGSCSSYVKFLAHVQKKKRKTSEGGGRREEEKVKHKQTQGETERYRGVQGVLPETYKSTAQGKRGEGGAHRAVLQVVSSSFG